MEERLFTATQVENHPTLKDTVLIIIDDSDIVKMASPIEKHDFLLVNDAPVAQVMEVSKVTNTTLTVIPFSLDCDLVEVCMGNEISVITNSFICG